MRSQLLVFLVACGLFIAPAINQSINAQSDDFETLSLCVPAKESVEAGQVQLTLDSGGQQRVYVRYIPASYDPNIAAPLVLNLHGFMGWASQQAEMTGMSATAEAHGFILVNPQGTGGPLRWNTGEPFSTPEQVEGDITFISELLDALETELCIDPARIYVSGLSNGGGMSHVLACALSDRIAAIGSVAGAQNSYDQPCEITRPIPVIAFHGTDDRIVPYNGQVNRNYTFPPIADWVAAWAERDGCDADAEIISGDVEDDYPVAGDASAVRYVDCDDDAEVVFYTIDGGGHSWPGSAEDLPAVAVGKTTHDINANEIMWQFFRRHPMPLLP